MHIRKLTTAFSAILLLVALAACGNDKLLGNNQGRVRVVLSGDLVANAQADAIAASADLLGDRDDHENDGDRPSRWFQAANVTLSSILVRGLDGVLVNLDLDLPITVDVVQIEGGKVIELPDGALPIGAYDQVVVVMTAVQGVTRDGTTITIEPPGGGWTSIIPICAFEVAEGGTATVGLTLTVRNSFTWIDNHFHFQPRFRSAAHCDDEG